MTFASLEFALLLTGTFILYYFFPQRGRMLLLLIASYVFYCYWNPVYGFLIFASTLLDYYMAIAIAKAKTPGGRRTALLVSIIGNLGILSYFKYTDFALDSLRALLGPLGQNLPGPVELILPVGISFYTFQTMSYTIDVYRGHKEPEKDFILVALFVSFFPQLVAGPIERAKNLMPQLSTHQRFDFRNMEKGIRLIFWGLLKKLVVADRLIVAAYPAYLDPAAHSTGELVFSAAAMFVVIYLDFSAYSEIARGTARLFGIQLTVNFKFPQAAGNIAEFWRRWHITMSTWVRDYLFMPLGGFHPRRPWYHSRNTLITMGLVGLWHGAQWTFVLWGLAHGVYLILYQNFHIHFLRRFRGRSFMKGLSWGLGAWLFNTVVRILISVLFFSPGIQQAKVFYSRMLGSTEPLGFYQPHLILGFVLLCAFWIFHYMHSRTVLSEKLDMCHPVLRGCMYTVLAYIILFGSVDTAEKFIYFQF